MIVFRYFKCHKLVYPRIIKFRVKETLNSSFDNFIEFRMSNFVGLLIWLVCMGFWTNLEGPFRDICVACNYWYLVSQLSLRSRTSIPHSQSSSLLHTAFGGLGAPLQRVKQLISAFTKALTKIAKDSPSCSPCLWA